MTIYLKNNSKRHIIYSIDKNSFNILQPNTKIPLLCDDEGNLNLFIKHNYSSQLKKRWFGREFHLVINSEYNINSLSENTEIDIYGEETCIYTNIYYDRFFITNFVGNIVSQYHLVSDAEVMLSSFKKRKIVNIISDLATDVVVLTPGGLFLIGKLLKHFYKWEILIIYYIMAYLILILLFAGVRWILWNKTDKRETKEFCDYLSNEYIIEYYSSPNRKPWFGEIEYK